MIQYFIYMMLVTFILADNEVCFEIEPNPNQSQPGFAYFTKYINVLDCFDIYAPSNISDEKVLHAAAIAAELLDNDEDGEVDDLLLKQELSNRGALMPLFISENSQVANSFFDNYDGEGASAVLFNNEIDPSQPGHFGDDASVEEIIHTINHVGHVNIYPDIFNIEPNSSVMSDAMDIARGGQFLVMPNQYPEEAWFHYDDFTCDYECMAIEYFYWCEVSYMGILDDLQTCNDIDNEWELCTPELFESTDTIMHGLLSDLQYKLPQNAPDGNYCPTQIVQGDLNSDGIINILDVIQTVNIILGQSEQTDLADLNADMIVNILDIVILVDLILS